jgi:sulfur transfer complex TusBCD TusB component (DsrH family)
MTANEFNQLCQSHLVDPEIALESLAIIEALQARGTHQQIFEKVEQVLTSQF